MRTKYLTKMLRLALLGALALMPLSSTAQNGPCNNPPNCIVNGTLASSGTGDLNSPVTVNGWNVSHGSPTVFGNDCPSNTTNSSIWMWSYSGNGEGVYTCYNFQQGQSYNVCLWVRNTNTVANGGQLWVRAVNGFTNINPTGSGVPAPASVQTIGTNPGNNMTWQQITFPFTANANYAQLWIYPLMTNGPLNNQQYELQIDDIRVTPAINPASLSISASPSTITWCGSSTLSVSGVPAGATVTWAPATGLSSTTGATVTASPCATTTYTATVTPAPVANCPTCGTQNAVTLTQVVTVTQPSFSITGNTNLNCGDNLTLSVTPNLFCNELTYDWNGPNGFNTIGNGFSIPNVTAANAGVYTVDITNANGGCVVSLAVNVTVAPCVPCTNPPNCIVNSDLGATNTGNMNSSAATTINGWFVSHGTPTIFGNDCPTGTNSRSVWMWSYSGGGEGVYTCYDFQANNTYNICLWVRNTNGIANGSLQIFGANGLTNINSSPSTAIPVPTSQQAVPNTYVNSGAWVQLNLPFTPTQNFTQLWIYPFMANGPINNQQYELQIDDIRVTPAINPASLSISASPSTITWCGSSTLSVSGVPAGATVTWAPATGLSSTTGATVTASPCATTTYTATVTPATVANCPTCPATPVTLTQQVTVTQPTVSITGATTLQCGSTLNLTANPAFSCSSVTYNWSGPGGFTATGQSISIPNVNTPNSGTYSVTIVNANGNCQVGASVNVTVSCVPCTNPPNCIVNGTLASSGVGDLNSPVTVNGWNVSHGSPTVFGNDCPSNTTNSSIWMWSYSGNGEGVYTCYNFQQGQSYDVCLWVRNTNTVANGGQLWVRAVNGFTNINPTGSGLPAPASVQTIGTNPGNNMTWQQITFPFTANANYTQLWIYPLMTNGPLNNQQYELQIDDIRVTPSVNPASLTISATPSVITWCGSSTLSVSGVPAGATVTWAPATGLSSTTGATVTASPCATTTYTATVTPATVANCPTCPATPVILTQQVIVSTPAFTISGNTSLLCGDNLTLSVVPSLFCSEVSYVWTGPNGFSYSGPGFSIPGVTELNAGTYTVVITNANGGCTQTLSVNVEIDCPCVAKPDFKWDGCNPIQFWGGNSSSTPVISWYWDFGDGQTSTLQNPLHTYGAAGSYKVCLTILAVNSKGETCCDRICYEVEACPPPPCEIKADFSTYYIPNNPLAVGFVDVSTTSGGSICWYDIDFGDGSPLYSGPTLPASHTFPAYGSYNVCMEIWVCFYDASGNIIDRCSDKVCHEVGVWPISAAPSKLNDKPAPVVHSNIQVFPSPASNNVFVKVNNMDKATVQIYNASGQEVGKAVMTNKDIWQADVSEFAPGVYFVVVKDSKGSLEKGVFVKE
jgi:hypothetical protein